MIKGFRFTNQLASAEIDARIHQELLNKNDGIFYGMELSNTASSVTIDEGLCEVAGRPIAVIDTETVSASTENFYCTLVLEIDLSKESTKDVFNQAYFRILTSTSEYPLATKQDINVYNGTNTLYQLEFARFRSGTSGITDFKDTRKMLNFSGIYNQINNECQNVLNQIKEELKNVEDGSIYELKTEAEQKYLKKSEASETYLNKSTAAQIYINKEKIKTGTAIPTTLNNGDIYFQYFN